MFPCLVLACSVSGAEADWLSGVFRGMQQRGRASRARQLAACRPQPPRCYSALHLPLGGLNFNFDIAMNAQYSVRATNGILTLLRIFANKLPPHKIGKLVPKIFTDGWFCLSKDPQILSVIDGLITCVSFIWKYWKKIEAIEREIGYFLPSNLQRKS